MRLTTWLYFLVFSTSLFSAEYLVKLKNTDSQELTNFINQHGGTLSLVSAPGHVYKWTTSKELTSLNSWDENTLVVEKNRPIHLYQNPSLIENRELIIKELTSLATLPPSGPAYPDNPEILSPVTQTVGKDTLIDKAWGLASINGLEAFKNTNQGKGIVVAVTDTGVDYTHQDLVNNIWRNTKEISGNKVDDDNNGYVDDLVGWDFAANDNKPYDLSLSLMDILLSGGNPGHGTHVAGVIGSLLENGMGIAGVAPQVKIMALRFITEKGQGSTEHAIKAIDYAVANGANIINASWGGEKDSEDDTLLKEAIKRAEQKGVILAIAAGNGRVNASGTAQEGFDNDTDAKPIIPASYPNENIVAVAALDSAGNMGKFSNWGKTTVDLGAPGVKVLSTVPGNRYQDTIVELGSTKVTWDGTSMACPHVAGALAVVWGENRSLSFKEVKNKLLSITEPLSSLSGKVVTNGRLDLKRIK